LCLTSHVAGYGFLVFDDPKFVPQALQTICSTQVKPNLPKSGSENHVVVQVAPGVYLSAQMSHASMR
jgi:hypothetical protein